MKSNRLMVDYERQLDDSIARFPNYIRIAYKKLESEFPNPNKFRLTYFGSEIVDTFTHSRTVYFSYKVHDSSELYSKIQVINDTAKILSFNKNINDTTYLNARQRLYKRTIQRITSLSNDIKRIDSGK